MGLSLTNNVDDGGSIETHQVIQIDEGHIDVFV